MAVRGPKCATTLRGAAMRRRFRMWSRPIAAIVAILVVAALSWKPLPAATERPLPIRSSAVADAGGKARTAFDDLIGLFVREE